jgi:AraC-like DNA-binding protein/mannose-6-phosphate isomerase-like protein (cupin superfamily)
MGIKTLNIGENQLENRDYAKNDSFPFRIGYEEINNYMGSSFGCHWHPELEFTYIISGSMIYQANNNQYLFKEGDALFVNQNCLHSGAAYHHLNCKYFAITFHPALISGHKNSIFENKYLFDIVASDRIPSAYLSTSDNDSKPIISILLELEKIYIEKAVGYELLIASKLFELWFYLYQNIYVKLPNEPQKQDKNIIQIKSALDYIHAHYKENISLEDISDSCNLSKSSCCRLFKKIVHKTPFDYFLNYRIQKSIPYLLNEGMNITEAAILVGFSNSSYYSEVFKKYMSCSPTLYKQTLKAKSTTLKQL